MFPMRRASRSFPVVHQSEDCKGGRAHAVEVFAKAQACDCRNVVLWHKADMPIALANVCSRVPAQPVDATLA
jgi:hypothetical protein